MLAQAAGADAVRHAEQRLSFACSMTVGPIIWPLIEDVREGIHLQRYGGREPVMEFHRQIVEGFGTLMADVREQTAERFAAPAAGRRGHRSVGGRPGGSSSTLDLPRERQPVLDPRTVDARKPQRRRGRSHGNAGGALLACHDGRGRIGVRQAMARETALIRTVAPTGTRSARTNARLRRCSTA